MTTYELTIPEGFDPELAVLIAAWRDGTREWQEEMGDVEDAAVTWQFGADRVSIGSLLLHMIDCDEGWIRESMFGEDLSIEPIEALQHARGIDVDARTFPEPPAWPFAKYVELMAESRARLIEKLKPLRAADFYISRGGNKLSYRWVISHLVQHDSYHGGQIVLLHEEYKKLKKETR